MTYSLYGVCSTCLLLRLAFTLQNQILSSLSSGAVCVVPSPYFSWQRGMPWRFFACPKNKETKDREHKTHFPHFLWVITQIKLEKLGFFLWNAGRNGVKTEQRDCEKWLIVAISSVWFAKLCVWLLNSQKSVHSTCVCVYANVREKKNSAHRVRRNICMFIYCQGSFFTYTHV